MDLAKIAGEVKALAKQLGWAINETRIASTGSIYIELVRGGPEEHEWLVVRVANHKQVYHRWITTVSIAPSDRWFEELEDILTLPYGDVGDIL